MVINPIILGGGLGRLTLWGRTRRVRWAVSNNRAKNMGRIRVRGIRPLALGGIHSRAGVRGTDILNSGVRERGCRRMLGLIVGVVIRSTTPIKEIPYGIPGRDLRGSA